MRTAGEICLLEGVDRDYAWGSHEHIPQLRGDQPDGSPLAEVWFGAHASAPSILQGTSPQSLLAAIEADPETQLGAATLERFGTRLPYLLKLLAAAQPLSIQVHPSIEQAIAGCAREDAAGIPRDAANRSFRDDNHKPELIAALTEFEALVGFRDRDATLDFLGAINADATQPVVEALQDGLGSALGLILTMDPSTAAAIVADVIDGCASVTGRWADEAELLIRLNATYPGDAGVLSAMLLNRLVLQPGEAIYLDAGNLHAYVSGFGVEIMANSDNVLRGGLTPKHMDVPALLDVVRPEALTPEVLRPDAAGAWKTPAPEFTLTRLDGPSAHVLDVATPHIALSTGASLTVSAGESRIEAGPGQAVWIPASAGQVSITTTGSVHLATVPV